MDRCRQLARPCAFPFSSCPFCRLVFKVLPICPHWLRHSIFSRNLKRLGLNRLDCIIASAMAAQAKE